MCDKDTIKGQQQKVSKIYGVKVPAKLCVVDHPPSVMSSMSIFHVNITVTVNLTLSTLKPV